MGGEGEKQFTPSDVAPSAPFDPARASETEQAAVAQEKGTETRGSRSKAASGDKASKEPRMVKVVYRGPSGALIVEGGIELRLHEPGEIPEDVLQRVRQHLPEHTIEEVPES